MKKEVAFLLIVFVEILVIALLAFEFFDLNVNNIEPTTFFGKTSSSLGGNPSITTVGFPQNPIKFLYKTGNRSSCFYKMYPNVEQEFDG